MPALPAMTQRSTGRKHTPPVVQDKQDNQEGFHPDHTPIGAEWEGQSRPWSQP